MWIFQMHKFRETLHLWSVNWILKQLNFSYSAKDSVREMYQIYTQMETRVAKKKQLISTISLKFFWRKKFKSFEVS